MKKLFTIFLGCILLAACERPATISSWSPINDVNTPAPASTQTAVALLMQTPTNTVAVESAEATPLPTLDLKQFPDPLPESLKGYELVSWQAGETWNFTLITGTNRMKTFEELMQPDSSVSDNGFVKITVTGVDQIKKVLSRLPSGSEVFWGGMDLSGQVPEGTVYFSYPSLEVMNEIADFCVDNEISLVNLSEPQ